MEIPLSWDIEILFHAIIARFLLSVFVRAIEKSIDLSIDLLRCVSLPETNGRGICSGYYIIIQVIINSKNVN